jgi:hypothetical protein
MLSCPSGHGIGGSDLKWLVSFHLYPVLIEMECVDLICRGLKIKKYMI